jgi:hypothetical protein
MPFDGTGFLRVLTEIEARDLAVLKRARHRIRYRWMWFKAGWWTTPFRLFFGHSCAEIAILRSSVWRFSTMGSVIRRLKRQLPEGWLNVYGYNDYPATTHADILGLFDRAIAALEHGE